VKPKWGSRAPVPLLASLLSGCIDKVHIMTNQ
jgi:hypothetical protein